MAYKIKAGDTLSKIAKALGTTVAELKKTNNIKDVNKIKAGATIKTTSKNAKGAKTEKKLTKAEQAKADAKAKADKAKAAAKAKEDKAKAKAKAEKAAANTPIAKTITQAEKDAKTATTAHEKSAVVKDAEKWRTGTIDDISKKYGFDYSQSYADKQAGAEAQAKLDGIAADRRDNKAQNESTNRTVDQGVANANNALDHSFFQQMLSQGQSSANSGMNSGIAGDANLRLAMNKQSELASVYGQANEAKMSESTRFNNLLMGLNEQTKTTEVERVAKAASIFQDRQQQGYDNLQTEKASSKGYADTAYGKLMDSIAQINDKRDTNIGKITQETEYSGLYGGNKTQAQIAAEKQQKLAAAASALDQKQYEQSIKEFNKTFALNEKESDRNYALAVANSKRSSGGSSGGSSRSSGSRSSGSTSTTKKGTGTGTGNKYLTTYNVAKKTPASTIKATGKTAKVVANPLKKVQTVKPKGFNAVMALKNGTYFN